jgi:hypothetical protein
MMFRFPPAICFPSPENRRFAARLCAPGNGLSARDVKEAERTLQESGNGRRIGCVCAAARFSEVGVVGAGNGPHRLAF